MWLVAEPSHPAHGGVISTIRIACDLRKIAATMWECSTRRPKKFQKKIPEVEASRPLGMPYDAIFDNNTYASAGGMGNGPGTAHGTGVVSGQY
jgi:hypothetical protein